MLGAIVGDVVGSRFEGAGFKGTELEMVAPGCAFTDDTVLTVATAAALVEDRPYGDLYQEYFRRYPSRGFGGWFVQWGLSDDPQPYGSFGNGSAMRVAPVGWAFDDLDTVLAQARATAEPTHDHPQGIAGAQAVAAAVFLARMGADREQIRSELSARFGYDLDRTVESIRPAYGFEVSCQRSVPEAIVAFLDSSSFEHAVRLAVSLGGDSDTQACISGAVAEAFYGGVPEGLAARVTPLLDRPLLEIVQRFAARYGVPLPAAMCDS